MKRCLITGVSGFLGSHLAEFLLQEGWDVAGTVRRDSRDLTGIRDSLGLFSCDILDRKAMKAALTSVRPDVIFHLAAQSSPSLSWKDPETTFTVNIQGTLSLLEAIRHTGLTPLVLVASSSAVYGVSSPEEIPIDEARPLRPLSPYGVSKAAVELLANMYHSAYAMKIIRVRPFLIVGARKTGDACSDFARGIVEIERGERRCLKVGTLEAVRDFLDVRDGVAALSLLAEKGQPGEAYNLCSGVGRKVGEILDALVSMAAISVPVERDPARSRLSDEPVMVGDNAKLRALGWEPRIPTRKSLEDILTYWRCAQSTATSEATI